MNMKYMVEMTFGDFVNEQKFGSNPDNKVIVFNSLEEAEEFCANNFYMWTNIRIADETGKILD